MFNFRDFLDSKLPSHDEFKPDVPSVFGADKYTILELIGKLMRWKVSTVNGVAPDKNGNVNVEAGAVKKLTFTGAAQAVFDGTQPVTVNIPQGGSGGVTSVNGKTGTVVLNSNDVGAPSAASFNNLTQTVSTKYGSDNPPPYPVTKVNNKTGSVTLNATDVGALPNTTTTLPNPNKLVFTGASTAEYDGRTTITVHIPQSGGEGGAVDSVNGKTGDVTLTYEDVGAPSLAKIQEIESDVGNLTTVVGNKYDSNNPPPYPVTKVNNKTGNVVLSASDVGALPTSTTKLPNPHKITFTGASAGEYDGSSAITINIPEGGGGGAVDSVNGKTGNVVLTYDDVGAPSLEEFQQIEDDVDSVTIAVNTKYGSDNPPPYPVTKVNNKTGNVTISASDIGAATTTQLNTLSDTVATKYSSSNPPPYPVTKVNNKTGAVTLTASDVGAATTTQLNTLSDTVATKYSSSNPPPYPVTKVNNKTGAITLTASDVGALPSTTTIPSIDATLSVSGAAADAKATGDKIAEIQLYKFPNATIIGSPTINNGQISNFSSSNYLQMPFIVDFSNRPFIIDMAFTTGSNVTTQQNLIDSNFGMAVAVSSRHFVLAISSNGTSWNIGNKSGTYTVLTNTTYYVRVQWSGTSYTLSYSTDKATYRTDITISSSLSPNPAQVYIGIGDLGKTTTRPWLGIINLNNSSLTISDKIVWQGMDDVGLATRANVSLGNIDADGESVIKKLSWPFYSCTLIGNNWTATGDYYTQSVPVTNHNAPPMTSTTITDSPMFNATNVKATNETLTSTLAIIMAGQRIPGNGTMRFIVFERPSSDIEIFMRGR